MAVLTRYTGIYYHWEVKYLQIIHQYWKVVWFRFAQVLVQPVQSDTGAKGPGLFSVAFTKHSLILPRCWLIVVPTSTTLTQQSVSIRLSFRVSCTHGWVSGLAQCHNINRYYAINSSTAKTRDGLILSYLSQWGCFFSQWRTQRVRGGGGGVVRTRPHF